MTKNIFKLLALALALMLALTGCGLIKVDQAAEDKVVVAEYDGGQILKAEASKEYNELLNMYQSYGYGEELKKSDVIQGIKNDVLEYMVRDRINTAKAAEFGVGEVTEEKRIELVQGAADEYNQLVNLFITNFQGEGISEEEALQSAKDYLLQNGVDEETMKRNAVADYKDNALVEHVTKDVTLSDEDLKKAYDEAVESDKETYTADPASFGQAAQNGDEIYWAPEGYRTVKHILITPSDERQAELSNLEDKLSSVNFEIEDRAAPPEEAEDIDGEGDADLGDAAETEEGEVQGAELTPAPDATVAPVATEAPAATETSAVVETPVATDEPAVVQAPELDVQVESPDGLEVTAEPVIEDAEEEEDLSQLSDADLQARKADLEKQIEDVRTQMKDELMPIAQGVLDRLNAGEDFDALMKEVGQDPGMQQEPAMTDGYYVSAESTDWVAEFRDAAMSLQKVGDISEPVETSYGLHIIRYNSDVTPGAADFEAVKEGLREQALADKKSAEFERVTEEWYTAANVKLYPNRL